MTDWTGVFTAPYAPFYIMLLNIWASLMTHAIFSSLQLIFSSVSKVNLNYLHLYRGLDKLVYSILFSASMQRGQRSCVILILSGPWLPPTDSYLTHCMEAYFSHLPLPWQYAKFTELQTLPIFYQSRFTHNFWESLQQPVTYNSTSKSAHSPVKKSRVS